MGDTPSIEKLEKQIRYYKKQLDEMAGAKMRDDYEKSGLRHSLKQKEQAFSLLSSLQTSVGTDQSKEEIYEKVIDAVNGKLVMDKTAILTLNKIGNAYRVTHCVGFSRDEKDSFKDKEIQFIDSILSGEEVFLVNKKTEPTNFANRISEIFNLPFFVATAIIFESQPIAVLITGRLREAKPLYPALDNGDIDTMKSIVGFIVATFDSMKIRSLKKIDQMKTKFFSNISHEFRTPITLTIAPLEKVERGGYGAIPEEVREILNVVIRNQKRLLNLINQILDLSKLESGKMELKISKLTHLGNFINKRAEQFRESLKKRGLYLKVDIEENIPEVFLDIEKIETVLFNLLSNAFKFTEKGGITIEASHKNRHINIKIKDSGKGIAADQVNNIFDRFSQARGSDSKDYAGTGIGLSLVKEIVELHSGNIKVESVYGEGTTFIIQLLTGSEHLGEFELHEIEETDLRKNDISIAQVEGLENESHLQEIDEFNKKSLKKNKSMPLILYAEDNPDLRRFVSSALEKDFRVILAQNGKIGFQLAEQHEDLSLIISDLMMPVWSGNDFLKAAKKSLKLRKIPFIVLTAKTELDSRINNLEEGVDDYLNKPFSEGELIARVRNLVKLRQQQVKIKNDLLAARKIQQALTGPRKVNFNSIGFETLFYPCDELSGDFYDIFDAGEYCYFYVADIESHGVASAQVTYLLKEYVNGVVEIKGQADFIDVFKEVCQRYVSSDHEKAMVMQFARVQKSTNIVEYAVSGTYAPILFSDGSVNILESHRNPYLVPGKDISELNFETSKIELKKGDSLFLFSDGCFEIPMPSKGMGLLGVKGFSRILKKIANNSDWSSILMENLKKLGKRDTFDDDLTVMRLSI